MPIPQPRIENYLVLYLPEGTRLQGEVFGHPRFADGTIVTTSVVRKWQRNGKVRTHNSKYTLGTPFKSDAS